MEEEKLDDSRKTEDAPTASPQEETEPEPEQTQTKETQDNPEEEKKDDCIDEEEEDEDDDVQVTIDDEAISNLRVKQRQSNFKPKTGIDVDGPGNFNGQPILEVNLNDLEEKPWRKPGADISDYFNYGFNEETWKLYCDKQKNMRALTSDDIPASNPVEIATIPIAVVNSNNSKYNKPYMNYPRRQGPYFTPAIVPEMPIDYDHNNDFDRAARDILERERALEDLTERHHQSERRSDTRDKDRDRRQKERDRRDKDKDRRSERDRRHKDHDRRDKEHDRRNKDRDHDGHKSSRHKNSSRKVK